MNNEGFHGQEKPYEETDEGKRHWAELEKRKAEWLAYTLSENGVSQEEWDILPKSEQRYLERKWEAELSPEYKEARALKERLQTLVGKKVSSFETDRSGSDISIKFEDGTTLEFTSWDPHDDCPLPEGVEVHMPEDSKE